MAQELVFSVHALRRMSERRIAVEDVEGALSGGEVVEDYPDDQPYPSRLMLGWSGSRPIHVVIAENAPDNETVVVTAYEPEPGQWDASFRRRTE
ncbi:MAG TPA: DUF4258 domain-containing protein [Candidatus Acidoferrales bacterium]|nr:DUF4258 domain-containing protein [Candidatus Acidoferrales bacterium]